MPRDLSDVLHYFIPEAEPPVQEDPARVQTQFDSRQPTRRELLEGPYPAAESASRAERLIRNRPAPTLLPLVAVPIESGDVVGAAFTWNLAVEISRLGGRAIVLTPDPRAASARWPKPGVGPLGAELERVAAYDLGSLHRAACNVAVERAGASDSGGLVLVHVPPSFILGANSDGALLRWTLLFTSCQSTALSRTFALSKQILRANALGQIGISVHGAADEQRAEAAFERISRTSQQKLGRKLLNYGLLTEDLHVYRSIVARQPIGLAHPQSPPARALRQVARMLLDDARSRGCAESGS